MAWLLGYSKRKKVTLTGGTSGAQTDYQTKLDVTYDSDMQADFDDLRFTELDGETLLDAWLESKTDSTSAVVWVETDTPANGIDADIYMYYGNSGAVSDWSGEDTFMFFADFADGTQIPATDVPVGYMEKDVSNPLFSANTSLTHEAGDMLSDVDIHKIGNIYYMFYSSSYLNTTYRCINVATSTDGMNWTRGSHNPLITYDGSGFDATRATYMCFLDDTADSGKYYILYTGVPGYDIGLAESTTIDNNYTKYASNPVLSHSSATWHNSRIHNPVLWKEGSTYYMLFSGSQSDNEYKIGLATSTNMTTWTEYSGNPVMTIGVSGEWDDTRVVPEHIEKIGSTYYLYYGGWNGSNYRVGIATSTDLHTWSRYACNPIIGLGGSGSWDEYLAGDHCSLVNVNNDWWVYYTGVNVGQIKGSIGLTYLKDGNCKFPISDMATCSVSNNIITVTGSGNIASGTSAWGNYVVEAKSRLDTDYGIALFSGVSDMSSGAQDYNRFIWKGGSWDYFQLHQRIAGSWTQVGSNVSAAPSVSTWYWLRIIQNGSSIRCYSSTDHDNWTERFSETVTENQTGEIGLGSYSTGQSSFDDVIVRKYVTNPATYAFGSEEDVLIIPLLNHLYNQMRA